MTRTTTLTTPTIHLNGTNQRDLLERLQTAYVAVGEALTALCATYPHGRDYYVQGPTAIQTAIAEHHSRLKRLSAVQDELQWLAIAVDQQGAR
jgi:hypothetical protein